MLVNNTTDTQSINQLNNLSNNLSETSELIEAQISDTSSSGLSGAISSEAALMVDDSGINASGLITGKAEGQITDLTPEIARQTIDDAVLAMDSYNDTGAPEGYTRLSQEQIEARLGGSVVLSDDDTGFSAAVYQNDLTGDMTIAYRGSEADNWQEFQNDWLESDVGQAFFNVPESYKQGSELAAQIQAGYGSEFNVSLTGHSLGGGIANYAAIDNNMNYTAFNAAGLAKHTVESLGSKVDSYTGQGTVINDAYDPLTNYGGKFNDETWGNDAKHIGYDNLVFVDNNSFKSWWDTAFNFNKRVDAHNLKNVLPTLTAYAAMA